MHTVVPHPPGQYWKEYTDTKSATRWWYYSGPQGPHYCVRGIIKSWPHATWLREQAAAEDIVEKSIEKGVPDEKEIRYQDMFREQERNLMWQLNNDVWGNVDAHPATGKQDVKDAEIQMLRSELAELHERVSHLLNLLSWARPKGAPVEPREAKWCSGHYLSEEAKMG
jgi:hypothetical protein